MLLVCGGGLLYFNYWIRFVFSNIELLFFSDLSEAKYSVDELHSGCHPIVGLRSIFGGFSGGKYGNFAFLGLLQDESSVDLDRQKTPSGRLQFL
jgi:hypothetical protein